MNSSKPRPRWPLLSALVAISLGGCATPQPSSPPPVIGLKPQATPLPAEIKQISSEPSTDYLKRQDDFTLKVESWRQKAEGFLSGGKQKSGL